MFNRSDTLPFKIDTDPDNTYVMIDAGIVAAAKVGLSTAQKAVVQGYRYVPTQAELDSGQFPQWAGNDPSAVYFRAPIDKLQTALAVAKRWRADGQGESEVIEVRVIAKADAAAAKGG